MSAVGLESIDHTVQLTHAWINELDERLGWANKHHAYGLLRSVLQALRDWVPVNQAASFGAQLPELLRGVYYEQWRPAATPVKDRHRDAFVARIDRAFTNGRILVAPEAVSTVLEFLSSKMTAGAIEHIRYELPADVRAMWPVSSQAA
jgi:uncharacterized protein (DUF2267 family)